MQHHGMKLKTGKQMLLDKSTELSYGDRYQFFGARWTEGFQTSRTQTSHWDTRFGVWGISVRPVVGLLG